MLSMFDVLIDVGGRDRWEGDPDPRYAFHPLDDLPRLVDGEGQAGFAARQRAAQDVELQLLAHRERGHEADFRSADGIRSL